MEGDHGPEIAGFRIESEIGRGGMGVVYLAEQSYPERRIALKLLSPDLAADPAFRERFVRESNAAASIEHPNVVPIYDAGEADGRLYLAMRYVEGTDLRSTLARDGHLSPERAARICAQVADALEAAHERGLVHRDVKPGNVLLDSREHAYLSDFGLIKPTRIDTELTRTGQFMGSLEYVAPEQIRGEAVDGRADLYSLGCVLYECLTGQPPFHRENEVATLYAHLEEPPPKPSAVRPDVPKTLEVVVERSMAKKAADRFATAGEMGAALRGPTPTSSHRPNRPRLALAIGLVLALALVVGGVIVASLGDEPTTAGATAPTSGTTGPTSPGASIPINSLLQLDSETGEVLSTTPNMPVNEATHAAVETGEGSVWVLNSGTLVRVNPADPAGSQRVTIGSGLGVSSLGVAEQIVWASSFGGVARVAASDLSLLREITLLEGAREVNVAVGAGGVWAVLGSSLLTRIDPRTAEVTGQVDIAQSATGITVGFGAVWVADDLTGTLTRVDPDTLEPEPPIQLAGAIDDVEAGAGFVWVLDKEAGVVTPVDPNSFEVGAPVRVGLGPTDLASGLDALWVANAGDGTISRVDQITMSAVTAADLGAPGAAIAVDEASRRLWVVVSEGGSA